MIFIIFLIAIIFSFAAFTSNIPTGNGINAFNGYFIHSVKFLGDHILTFILGFIIVAGLIFKTLLKEEKHPKKNHLAIVITQSIFIFITGFIVSFVILTTLAIMQLNFIAYAVNMSPSLLGIQTDVNDITTSLKKNNQPPVILASDSDHYKELQAIAYATTGTHSFYGKYILSSMPSFLVLPTKKIGSMMLIDKTLIISEIKNDELEKISPIIGYIFIKNYFPQKNIRHLPKISIMSDKEHVKFRKDDFAKKIKDLENEVLKTDLQISSISALIQKEKDNISFNENLIKNTYLIKNKIYSKCINEGVYKLGIFVKTNTKKYCDGLITEQEQDLISAGDNLDLYSKSIENNTNQLKTYTLLNDFFKAQSKLTNSLKVYIPSELGLYVPEDSIKIIINPQSPHAIADYFETVVHEYYHYASHTKDKGLATGFFEEGLTEYFARNTIKNSLDISTNMGFPVFVKIIEQISKIIPETELADIYFAKDEASLEKALNRVYGDNFYKDNLILFQSIQYTSDFKQLLKYANTLLMKINGKPIKESDLLSTSSNL